MNRKLGFIFILGFLSMQMLTSLHMAEHVHAGHEQDENTCQVCLNYEHTKYGTQSEAVAFDVPEDFVLAPRLPELLLDSSESYRFAFPRGPPLFS